MLLKSNFPKIYNFVYFLEPLFICTVQRKYFLVFTDQLNSICDYKQIWSLIPSTG